MSSDDEPGKRTMEGSKREEITGRGHLTLNIDGEINVKPHGCHIDEGIRKFELALCGPRARATVFLCENEAENLRDAINQFLD